MTTTSIKKQIVFVLAVFVIIAAVQGVLLIKKLRGNVQTLIVQNEQEKKIITAMQNDTNILYAFTAAEFPAQRKDFITKLQQQTK